MDFGTIMCWADNAVGQQKEPCVFHLIAAGKPDMPTNCTLVNQTSESLEVDCIEGNKNNIYKLKIIWDGLTGNNPSIQIEINSDSIIVICRRLHLRRLINYRQID